MAEKRQDTRLIKERASSGRIRKESHVQYRSLYASDEYVLVLVSYDNIRAEYIWLSVSVLVLYMCDWHTDLQTIPVSVALCVRYAL